VTVGRFYKYTQRIANASPEIISVQMRSVRNDPRGTLMRTRVRVR